MQAVSVRRVYVRSSCVCTCTCGEEIRGVIV